MPFWGGPNIFSKIFLSATNKFSYFLKVNVQTSQPYIKIDVMTVLYTWIMVILQMTKYLTHKTSTKY